MGTKLRGIKSALRARVDSGVLPTLGRISWHRSYQPVLPTWDSDELAIRDAKKTKAGVISISRGKGHDFQYRGIKSAVGEPDDLTR